MDNNILNNLAFTIYSNKGAYALFLGSGVSRSAGIPTGWEILTELIKRVAILNNESCENDNAEKWYLEKFREKPNYSKLLENLTLSSEERHNLLKPFFIPSEKEREEGTKLPTKAHRAIAELIKRGYIKVVVTTNFDRLLEDALHDLRIIPVVISSEDDIEGAMPIVHNKITILKINGDFMDVRFLNTESELNDYPPEIANYFVNILNNFGIISCGWSGCWDIALKRLVRRCQNFRFGSYWTYIGICNEELTEIANQRKGKTLAIDNADSFFSELKERIEALERFDNTTHPLSARIAVERLKKYIVKDEYRIDLHDLLMNECQRVIEKIRNIFNTERNNIKTAFEKYIDNHSVLLPLIIELCNWGNQQQDLLLIKILKRIFISPSFIGDPALNFINLYKINGLILAYGVGISALFTNKYHLLSKLFDLKESSYLGVSCSFIEEFNCESVIEDSIANEILYNGNAHYTPLNDFLYTFLRPYFSALIPEDNEYENYFNLFEYLCFIECRYKTNNIERIIHGRFRRDRKYLSKNDACKIIQFNKQAESQRDDFEAFKNGLFGGKYDNYAYCLERELH